MGKVVSAALAGSIVRRVREDRGMPRAELSAKTGIGARTLYALETGESGNFGLGNFLKVLNVLGLSMSIDYEQSIYAPAEDAPREREHLPWDDLDDRWKLDDEQGR